MRYAARIRQRREKIMNNTIVSPAEYFEQVKSRKRTMTADGLSQLYENCLALLEEYQRSGQIAAQKKLLFHIDNITREKKLLDLGIDTFVYKSDVDDFIHMVDNKVVKIVELPYGSLCDECSKRLTEQVHGKYETPWQKVEQGRGERSTPWWFDL